MAAAEGTVTEAAEATATDAPAGLGSATRLKILLYFGGLLVLMGFPENVIGLPISFFLKNKLHLAAHQLALFYAIAAGPTYVAVAFGFARDVWSPFGRGDRGFMMTFGALAAGLCIGFAFAPPVYATFLAAAIVLSACFLFIRSALRGLIATLGQQQAMSGQLAAAYTVFDTIPAVAGLLAGGVFSSLLEGDRAVQGARTLFLVGAGLLTAIALYGALKPRAVFANVRRERDRGAPLLDDFKRLVRHAPVYPALLIWLLWQFVPGFGTPFQYFLQDTLKFSDAQYGEWFALYTIGGVPGVVLYGWLCRRFALRTLLFWGATLAMPMMLPLMFIHQQLAGLAVAAPMGFLGGMGGVAIFDLIIRSCPKGLQGSMLMATTGVLAFDGQLGNLLGTALYDHFHDFTVCVIAMTITNGLILPAILLVPRHLIATPDGVLAPAEREPPPLAPAI